MNQETAAAPPPTLTPSKPALTEEEVEKKSTAIIEEYLHINDMRVCANAELKKPNNIQDPFYSSLK